MVKITGLDKLTRTLDDAQKAIAAIDGELGAVNFNPNDPGSIEAAIAQMEAMIDERLGDYFQSHCRADDGRYEGALSRRDY